MILIENDKSFRLKVVDFEFPSSKEYHDGNWLTIEVDVTDGDLRWEARDECLLAYELGYLRDWLSDLFQSGKDEIRFTENELSFRFIKEASQLVVVLDFHLHPKGQRYDYGENGDDEYLLYFDVNEKKVDGLINKLDQWLENFPVRNTN